MKDKYILQNPEFKGKYVNDGIIDENQYKASKPKILFIAKEPNNPNQEEGDYTEWWKEGPKYSFSINIAVWAYGILNDFPAYTSFIKENGTIKTALNSIAFMNVKKIGGSSVSKNDEILSHIVNYHDLLLEQINNIKPQIIINCLGNTKLREALYGELNWNPTDCGIPYKIWNDTYIIDFYHPSARMPNMASYALLKDVFKNLNL